MTQIKKVAMIVVACAISNANATQDTSIVSEEAAQSKPSVSILDSSLEFIFGSDDTKKVVDSNAPVGYYVVNEELNGEHLDKTTDVVTFENYVLTELDAGMAMFAVNSHKIKNFKALEAIVQKTDTTRVKEVRVTGHTDSTGSEKYNDELSRKRAEAVGSYLKANGFDSVPVTTTGVGASTPIATNKSYEGRAKNRRVEVVVVLYE